jgi:SPFH domain / Band 7 family
MQDVACIPIGETKQALHVDCCVVAVDRIVPERTAFVIERFGKYAKTLQPGLHLLIPIVSTMGCQLPRCLLL